METQIIELFVCFGFVVVVLFCVFAFFFATSAGIAKRA